MRVYCPNCKNTGDSIRGMPSAAVFIAIVVLMAGGSAGVWALVNGILEKNTVTMAIGFLLSPLPLLAFGVAIGYAKRVVNDDESERCPCCKYPWAVPHDWRKDGAPGVPPVIR